MPQQKTTNLVATIDSKSSTAVSYTLAHHENTVAITYQLARAGKGHDSLTLERLPGGVSITKRVSARGRGSVRTVNVLIPTELAGTFLAEFAALVESDDTDLGAPVAAIAHVAPRELIELHPAGGDLG